MPAPQTIWFIKFLGKGARESVCLQRCACLMRCHVGAAVYFRRSSLSRWHFPFFCSPDEDEPSCVWGGWGCTHCAWHWQNWEGSTISGVHLVPFFREIWNLVPWNVAMFVKYSEALKMKWNSAFSCSAHHSSSFTVPSQDAREAHHFQSGPPRLPVVTKMDAPRLCCSRTNKNKVMVLKIAWEAGRGWLRAALFL